MNSSIVPLISGLIGAIIGASASILTVFVQTKTQDRRERQKKAIDLALEDYKIQIELTKSASSRRVIPPIALFVDYHLKLSSLIERDRLTAMSYAKLCEENSEFFELIKTIDTSRKSLEN